jgi:DNA-binding NtrC family response regulator
MMATFNRRLIASVLDLGLQSTLHAIASELDFELILAADFDPAQLNNADCAVMEIREFGTDSMHALERRRQTAPHVPVIAVLTNASPADAIRFGLAGGFDYLATSSAKEELFPVLEAARNKIDFLHAERNAAQEEPWRRHLVGTSVCMDQVTRIIRLVASRRCTVLITGETGTGKEMAARAIHLASNRARRNMVCVNCSAIPENLIEAELFGHVKGAYTGAIGSRTGRFEQANGGTLFLDEIADLPFELQSKLLRALQEKEIQRLGGSETVKVDVRVIAATNADLLTRVREGRFREDLFYRLNVVPIYMPPLRERASDIPSLVNHFVQKVCTAEGIPVKAIAPGALHALSVYSWPGNVRQLENVVEHAVVMSGERECLRASDFVLPQTAMSASVTTMPACTPSASFSELPDEGLDFTETLRQFERGLLQQALTRAQGNKTAAADMLRIPRTTLIHKLRVLEQPVA